MSTIFGMHLSYETFIGLSAYATMGVFFMSSSLVYDWPAIKDALPFLHRVFGEKGVISDEVALFTFWVLVLTGWVATAVIADYYFV
jgi:hypothetical protein